MDQIGVSNKNSNFNALPEKVLSTYQAKLCSPETPSLCGKTFGMV